MSEEKAGAVQWIPDSAGVTSCHVNDGKLTLKESLIGSLIYRNDGWHILLPDGKGAGSPPFGTALWAAGSRAFDALFRAEMSGFGRLMISVNVSAAVAARRMAA